MNQNKEKIASGETMPGGFGEQAPGSALPLLPSCSLPLSPRPSAPGLAILHSQDLPLLPLPLPPPPGTSLQEMHLTLAPILLGWGWGRLLSLSPLFWPRLGHLPAVSALWGPACQETKPTDRLCRAAPAPVCPSPVSAGTSSSRKQTGAWVPGVMVLANRAGRGQEGSRRALV